MFRCTRCGRDINTYSAPDSCPHCGVRFSGVRCDGCGYEGSKHEFLGSRCPKCNSRVYIPNSYQSGSRPTTKTEKIWMWSILGIITFIVTGLVIYYYVYQPYVIAKYIKHRIELNSGTFTDSRDGNTYKTIKIGHQTWMAENLKYLPKVFSPKTSSNYNPFYYVYSYNGTNVAEAKATDNYKTYGVLYNWEAAMTACPKGWHLPSDSDWIQLSNLYGDVDLASMLLETGSSHWLNPKKGTNNFTGFTALPGGYCDINGFEKLGISGYWWSSNSDLGHDIGYYVDLSSTHYGISTGYGWYMCHGLSVRCVKN